MAQLLFVSIKAVEYHMSNVLKKLGAESRSELREALGSPGTGTGEQRTT